MEKHKIINRGDDVVLVLQKFLTVPKGESEAYFSKRTLNFARSEIRVRGLDIEIIGREYDEDKGKLRGGIQKTDRGPEK